MEGKVALVTGGAGGIGKAICQVLLKRHVKVTIADIDSAIGQRTEKELGETCGHQNVCFAKCDVTSEKDFRGAFEKTKETFGSIDIVCNNAGVFDEVNWERTLDINLNAVIRGTMLGIEYMGKHKGGHGGVVINIGSKAGIFPGLINMAYAAAKFGVVGFSRSIGQHAMGPQVYNVRVNCLCPSWADTDLLTNAKDRLPEHLRSLAEEHEKWLSGFQSLKPEYIAEGIPQLIEDESLSGDVLMVTSLGTRLVEFPQTEDDLKTKS